MLAIAGLFLLSAARADEVVLRDSRIVYGSVEERGASVWIGTRTGEFVVPRSEIVRIRGRAELHAELVGLASRCGKLSPFSCLHLAHTARDWDLADDMWVYLDRALGQQDMPDDVRERVDEFLGTLEPELLPRRHWKKSDPVKVRELFHALPRSPSPARAAATARVLARLEAVDAELRKLARALVNPRHRAVANEALWLRPEEANRRFVLRTTVLDRDDEVRGKAIDLARQTEPLRAAADYIAQWLVHDHPEVTIRAANALADLGEPSAVEALVRAGPFAAASASGSGPRAHAAFLTQQAYVRDYDVEVAQSSFIADPKVDVLQYGTVLDVRVGAVITERVVVAFRRAIAKLEGADPGSRPGTWEAWLAARRGSPQR